MDTATETQRFLGDCASAAENEKYSLKWTFARLNHGHELFKGLSTLDQISTRNIFRV